MKTALYCTLCLLLLGGCASAVTPEAWPVAAPSHRYFGASYHSDETNRLHQSEQEYLAWVRRFYEGRPGILGWNAITESVIQDMDDDQRAMVEDLGFRLGRRIAAEWAKDNTVRRIDTGMLSLWGSVIIAGDSPEERLETLLFIDRDTQALLRGELSAGDITYERYPGVDSFF